MVNGSYSEILKQSAGATHKTGTQTVAHWFTVMLSLNNSDVLNTSPWEKLKCKTRESERLKRQEACLSSSLGGLKSSSELEEIYFVSPCVSVWVTGKCG